MTAKSIGGEARNTPVMPPIRNTSRKPTAISIAVVKVIAPRHMVATQLKILMPVGTAISIVMIEKYGRLTAPVENMWCAQTPNDSAAMPNTANTIAR